MAQRFIDFNRGNDSNSGESPALAWKTLGKMTTEARAAGDEIFLANDSVFDLSARVLISAGISWSSTAASPIIIGSYSPTSAGTGKPIIRKQRAIGAGEWTYSAPNNAWTFANIVTFGAGCRVKLGGQWGIRTDTALPLPSVDRQYTNSGSTLYVYAPSGTDPTTYYGSVEFSQDSSDSPFVISSPGSVAGLVLQDLRFEKSCGPYFYNSTGTRNYVVRRIEGSDIGALVSAYTETAGSVSLDVSEVEASESSSYVITANGVSGVGIDRWDVHDCILSGANRSFPQGAIYSQLRNASVRIYDNVLSDMQYGVTGKTADGCAIYAETGAGDNLIYGNEVSDCHCAFQDNSGRRQFWFGNIVRNCYTLLRLTDESNNNATDFRFYNNVALNLGFPVAAAAGSGSSGIGIWAYETTSPAMKIDIRNNVMTMFAGCANPQPAIKLPASVDGGSQITTNCVNGFPAVAEAFDGGASPITPSGTVTTDPTPYLAGDGSLIVPDGTTLATLASANPLALAGTYVGGVTLRNGRLRPGYVPIGAYQAVLPRATRINP